MIKRLLKIAVTLLFVPAFSHANEYKHESSSVALLVYKTPTCGCCKDWISHIKDEDIIQHPKGYRLISPVKTKYGIKPNYRSCHTAVTRNGFAFEGHVPVKFIKQFLAEKHDSAFGLSVPAMPVGERFMQYMVLMQLKDGTSKVYAKVNNYKEQF